MMKYLKILGLVAVVALNLMAFLGADAASATVLCEETPAADCSGTKVVAKSTNIVFSAENSITLTGPFGEVIAACTKSTAEGAIGNQGSTTETVSGNISKLTFEECGKRTVTVNSATRGSLEVHHISGTDNGTVTSNDTTVIIEGVPIFGTCRYQTANTDIGTLTGKDVATGGAPTFDIAATIPHEAGSNCPNGTWEGSYEYTGTTNFNVAAGAFSNGTLCEETPAAGDCAAESLVAKGTNLVFSAEGSTTLTGPFGEVIATCTKSTAEGAIGNQGSTTAAVSSNISKLTFEECGGRTVGVNTAKTGTLEVHHIAGTDNGTVTSNDTTVIIEGVPIFGACQFLTTNTDIGTLTGKDVASGGVPTFDISATIPHEASSKCPNGTWEGSYEYKGTTNFNVAAG